MDIRNSNYMTPPENSPQAQEVKAVRAIATITWGTIDIDCIRELDGTEIDCDGIHDVEVIITPVPNENQPPLSEKTLLNPNPLSCQSDGNREKGDGLSGWTIYAEQYHVALRALAKLAMLGGGRSEGNCVAQEALDEINKIYKRMEPIQNAMNSQGGKP